MYVLVAVVAVAVVLLAVVAFLNTGESQMETGTNPVTDTRSQP